MNVERFYKSIENGASASTQDLISLFVYYLTVEQNLKATAASVSQCYQDVRLTPPPSIAQALSRGLTSVPQRYIKLKDGGYILQRHWQEILASRLGAHVAVVQTSQALRKLEVAVPTGPNREFLTETITCFEAGCNRAAITMCWILTIDHLYDHIFNHSLAAFNAELAKNTDKRVKILTVTKRDDFAEIPEGKFIEFARAAKIISNDVRKILEEKLGIRNSAAHPSGIEIKTSKVVEFIEDLVTNVLLKFKA